MIGVWIPHRLLAAMDHAVSKEDSDRSKFARRAIRHYVQQHGIHVEEGK